MRLAANVIRDNIVSVMRMTPNFLLLVFGLDNLFTVLACICRSALRQPFDGAQDKAQDTAPLEVTVLI